MKYKYYASEIDKYTIKVTQANFPNTIQLGDVQEIKPPLDWNQELDILVGGSPCQGFSFAGKQLNFDDERSKLFFEFVRLKDILKPKYFLLENVVMKQEYQDVISKYLGVKPIMINSSNFTAQNRKRLYWTNIKFTRSKDKGIVLNDILEDGGMADRDKSYCLDSNYFKGGNLNHYYKRKRRQVVFDKNGCKQVGEADLKGYDIIKRVYSRQGKSPTLTTMQGGWRMPKVECGQIINRKINPETGKRDDYNPNIKAEPRIETRSDGKTNTLSTVQKDNVVVNHEQMYWRALTPLECERLQTIPDKYTEFGAFPDKKVTWYTCNRISNSQRYKMLGNGFCVDTVADILKGEVHE